MCREAKRSTDDLVIRVIFGKQNGTLDCFHRAIDFIGGIMQGNVEVNAIKTLTVKFTAKHLNAVDVPEEFYGGYIGQKD